DIQMPEMDGYELAQLLRQDEKTVNMPFIFISAIYTDSINVFEGYEKGAFSYITKPFEPEVLIAKVKFFIDKYRQEQSLIEKTRQLELMNEELESFSYSVSHDLRAPLRAIGGFSKVLQRQALEHLNESHARYLRMIVENVEKMETLIEDLLAFSRMSRKEQNYVLLDPGKLAHKVYHDLVISYDVSKIDFVVEELPEIRVDQVMFEHVFSNLISNALKYSSTREKQVISLTGEDMPDETVISIKDNGVGFDAEYGHKLFKLFQRLHDSDEFEGTGVGLAIVKRIVNRHKGRVWAESTEGEGATFFIALPKPNQPKDES
ncbi:MAG: ATP-binding protein, partial [Marinoscillum sp.]